MSNKKQQIPDIRFKGFTDVWEQRKLGDVYTERNKRGNDSLKILSVSIHHGVSNDELDSNTLGKEVRRSEDKSLYKHVYFGDLVLNMMRAWQGAVGVVKSEAMVSPAYITAVPSAELYPLFMDFYLRRDEAIGQMNNLSYGVTDFRKRLYWDSFIKVLCHIPTVAEQEKITAFFTHLDDTIALHQRQLDNYKKLKNAMLQKVFNQELRFKDDYGNDYPEWEIKSFKDVFISIPSKEHQIKSSSYHEKGKYEVVDQGKEDVVGYSDQTEKLFENVPVIIFGDHTTNLKYRDNPFIVGADGVKLLKSTEQAKYSFYVLEQFNVNQEGYKRHYSMLQEINIPIPSRQEQQRIENLLSSIDNKNRKLIYKIALLMEMKKSFMQQMFV